MDNKLLKGKNLAFYKYFYENILYLDVLNIYLGNGCNLKCKDCATFSPLHQNIKWNSIERLKIDLDILMKKIDKIGRLNIVGGEPFLYPFINEYCEFIGNFYRNKINSVRITTNGSILPSDKTLDIINEYEFMIIVSDYNESNINKYDEIFKILLTTLRERNIIFELDYKEWNLRLDVNNLLNNLSDKELRNHYIRCDYKCKTLYNRNIHLCLLNMIAENLGLVNGDNNDIFDILNIDTKLDFLNNYYNHKDTGNGYLSFCKKCLGMDPKYKISIDRAIQYLHNTKNLL
jgi:organic radical activating enzyme